MSDLRFDFSGLAIEIAGVPEDLAAIVLRSWAGFEAEPGMAPLLRLEVTTVFAPDPSEPFAPKSMTSRLSPQRAVFAMAEGSVDVTADGRAAVDLRGSDRGRLAYALLNFARASIAWLLPSRGGAALHAAGLVHDGRAFVLAGSASSGKSTWAAAGERGGARVLSDDLVVLDGTRAGRGDLQGGRAAGAAGRSEWSFEALATPFRSTHAVPGERGRWPLAAILFPAHGSEPRLDPVGRMEARAKILSNLPFVAEGLASDARVASVVEALVASVPCQRLTFAPDPSFLSVLQQQWDRV